MLKATNAVTGQDLGEVTQLRNAAQRVTSPRALPRTDVAMGGTLLGCTPEGNRCLDILCASRMSQCMSDHPLQLPGVAQVAAIRVGARRPVWQCLRIPQPSFAEGQNGWEVVLGGVAEVVGH